MSFQGADVSGLDRTANRCMEGADFADTVAKALEILVAALEAMSWTGFAAALAAYLKAVVIPWVKYIAKCLRIFGGLLQLASSKQKDASEDAPPVSIPATAWNPPPAPTPVAVEPPRLSSPQPAIQQTNPGSGAQTGGGTSVAPVTGIGRTDTGGSGSGGGTAATPITTIGRTEPGAGNVTGGGSVTTTTGISPNGELWTRTTVTGGAVTPGTVASPTPISGSGSGLSTGLGGGTASSSTPVIDNCFGDGETIGSSGSSGSGGAASGSSGGSGSGSVGGPSTGAIGGGSGGATGGGSGSGGTGAETSVTSGDPATQSSTLASRAVLGGPAGAAGGVGTGSVEAVASVPSGGASAALAAAPLGLAGVGGAALAALRAKGLHDGDDEEGDDALQ